MRRSFLAIGFAAGLLLAPAVPAQEHRHSHGEMVALGRVHFPTSCRGVDAGFTRAVALLHSPPKRFNSLYGACRAAEARKFAAGAS